MLGVVKRNKKHNMKRMVKQLGGYFAEAEKIVLIIQIHHTLSLYGKAFATREGIGYRPGNAVPGDESLPRIITLEEIS